jgi:serine/threonine-protein kinase
MIFVKGKEPTETCNVHNKVPVPDVVGLSIEEARQIFTDLNFVINESFEFNDTYNENIVFGIDPAPGTILESLTGEQLSVTLQVSKGPQTYEMPNLIGLKKDMAEQMLSSIGIPIANVIYDFSIEQPVDQIYKQDPLAAAIVTKNTTVTIYISKGEDPEATIPNVVGMVEVDALAALNNAGFKNVSVQKEESDKEIDKVFAQIPDSGTKYTKISEIIIKISRGILVPDVTGKKKEDAISALQSLGFIVVVTPDPLAEGKVKSQIPAAGSHINYGDTVAIEIEVTTSTTTTTTTTTTTSTTASTST